MSLQDGINSLYRSEIYIAKLSLDTPLTGGSEDYISYGEIPDDQNILPCITKIDWIPARASEDGGIGYLGEVTIRCKDFKYGERGTFFGKLIASNIYTLNRVVDIYSGYYSRGEPFSFSDFEARRYFIKSINGPDQSGNITIKAADVLSQLRESEMLSSSGSFLTYDISETFTQFINITNVSNFTQGTHLIINDEIMEYYYTAGNTIKIDARGQGGTEAAAHETVDEIRPIYNYNGNVVDAIRDIIEKHTDIDHANYIDDTEWNAERDDNLASETVDVWVVEPETVDEVIDRICKESYINLWWDHSAQLIKIKAINPSIEEPVTWTDEDNILDASVAVKRDQRKVLTDVFVYFGKREKTGSDDAKNYSSVYYQANEAIRSGLGQDKELVIFNSTVPDVGTGVAAKIAGRIINQNKEPIEFSCYVDAKDSSIQIGDHVKIESDYLQDSTGNRRSIVMRVIERSQRENSRFFYKMVFSGQSEGARYARIAPAGLGVTYATATDEQKSKYGFIAPLNGGADDPYLMR